MFTPTTKCSLSRWSCDSKVNNSLIFSYILVTRYEKIFLIIYFKICHWKSKKWFTFRWNISYCGTLYWSKKIWWLGYCFHWQRLGNWVITHLGPYHLHYIYGRSLSRQIIFSWVNLPKPYGAVHKWRQPFLESFYPCLSLATHFTKLAYKVTSPFGWSPSP